MLAGDRVVIGLANYQVIFPNRAEGYDGRAGKQPVDRGLRPLRSAHVDSTGSRRTITPGVDAESLTPGSWSAT